MGGIRKVTMIEDFLNASDLWRNMLSKGIDPDLFLKHLRFEGSDAEEEERIMLRAHVPANPTPMRRADGGRR
jgi:hypothetical protein